MFLCLSRICSFSTVSRFMNVPLSDGGDYIVELRAGLAPSLPNMESIQLVIFGVTMLVPVAIAIYSNLVNFIDSGCTNHKLFLVMMMAQLGYHTISTHLYDIKYSTCNLTWTSFSLKLLVIRLFIYQLMQTHTKEAIPKSALLALYEGNSLVTGGSPTQRVSNAEKASIWGRNHALLDCSWNIFFF